MPLSFKKPPINELVITTLFNPPIGPLRAEHVGQFWAMNKSAFPSISQQPVIGPEIGFEGEIYPLPRYWLSTPDDVGVLQIQKTGLFFNWRRRDVEYPHFHGVKSVFDRHFQNFADFLKRELQFSELTVAACELAYINLIPSGELWSGLADIGEVFPGIGWIDPADGAREVDINQSCAAAVSDDMVLSTSIRNAKRAEDQKPVLYFELKASGALPPNSSKSAADEWFDRAHKALDESFLRTTSSKAQTHWGPQ
jgi:uncharacterized protein (TIGR04255 family)